jgi:KipI family sensor histidine kinase inhibitor
MPQFHAYGDRALLIDCESTGQVAALAEALLRDRPPGVVDVVAGARTVLVTVARPEDLGRVRAELAARRMPPPEAPPTPGTADVVIDVVYDGPDLAEVAGLLGMPAAEVIAAHTGTPWRVGFGGFAPGFAYLVDGDPRLAVPRRAEPRTRVPAGSVALAGEFSGIYPRESPGGWQLIGRTEAVLWEIDRDPPALLTPGMWVRFRSAGPP